MTKLIASFPAHVVFEMPETGIATNEDKGYVKTSSVFLCLKGFPRDKYEWIRKFTVGVTSEGEYFVNSNAAMLTSGKRETEVCLGVELGQEIKVNGIAFRVEQAPNNNLKLVRL